MMLKSVIRDMVASGGEARKLGEILIDMRELTREQLEQELAIKAVENPSLYLGEHLLKRGIISEETLDTALRAQSNTKLSALLSETTDEGVLNKCEAYGVSKQTLIENMTRKSGVQYIDLAKHIITEKMLKTFFQIDMLKRNNIILFEIAENNTIWKFASSEVGDVSGFKARTKAEGARMGIRCEFYFAFDFEIQNKFEALSVGAATGGDQATNAALASTDEGGAVELVNNFILDGINRGASDIHIEPRKGGLRVRYRIDGLISYNETFNMDTAYAKSVISRIKVMANMDVASSRKPQDGLIKDFSVANKRYDLRVSTIQIIHGEKIVIRIAAKEENIKTFIVLGFLPEDAKVLESIISKTNGIFFIAGATGSGKTTTMYSIINKLNTPNKNICTIEDPIEREISDINQVQVSNAGETSGMRYPDYLRAFLRQDPDIIIVGETRDKETADTAMRASLTGHFVLSTIHANNALETISRMYDMEIDTFILSTTLEGLLSQRLVRKVCPKCAVERDINDEERDYLKHLGETHKLRHTVEKVRVGRGCPECTQTGFKGRVVIAEVIAVDPVMRRLINHKASTEEIAAHLDSIGHRDLVNCGIMRVIDGTTNITELKRVL